MSYVPFFSVHPVFHKLLLQRITFLFVLLPIVTPRSVFEGLSKVTASPTSLLGISQYFGAAGLVCLFMILTGFISACVTYLMRGFVRMARRLFLKKTKPARVE